MLLRREAERGMFDVERERSSRGVFLVVEAKLKPRGTVEVGRGVERGMALEVRRRGVASLASDVRRVGVLSDEVDWREGVSREDVGREGGGSIVDRRELLLADEGGREVERVEDQVEDLEVACGILSEVDDGVLLADDEERRGPSSPTRAIISLNDSSMRSICALTRASSTTGIAPLRTAVTASLAARRASAREVDELGEGKAKGSSSDGRGSVDELASMELRRLLSASSAPSSLALK